MVLGWTLGLTGASVAQEKLTVRAWDFRASKDIKPQIEEFEKLFPDVKIDGINVGYGDHVTELMVEINNDYSLSVETGYGNKIWSYSPY